MSGAGDGGRTMIVERATSRREKGMPIACCCVMLTGPSSGRRESYDPSLGLWFGFKLSLRLYITRRTDDHEERDHPPTRKRLGIAYT